MKSRPLLRLSVLALILLYCFPNYKAEAQLDSASIIWLTKRINERGWESFSRHERDSIFNLLQRTKVNRSIYDGPKGFSREEIDSLKNVWEKRKLNRKQQPLERKARRDTSGTTDNPEGVGAKR